MGSYWAYYTLGWGGFWFWDPVENASLMPWLAGTALLHSAAVMEKRDALKIWTIFLAILAFSLSLLGTFLVRSGVLTSVHAFASDPQRGVFILAILVLFIGGSLLLFAARAPSLKPGGLFAPVSREGALVLNNLLLTTSCATVFVGTLYPLALEALTGEKISVGAPFFNLTFGPSVRAALSRHADRPDAGLEARRPSRRRPAADLRRRLGCVGWRWCSRRLRGGPVFAVVGCGVAVYLIVGSFVDIVRPRLRPAASSSNGACARGTGCRCRPGARLSPMPAWASPCSASRRPAGASKRSSAMKPGDVGRRRPLPDRLRDDHAAPGSELQREVVACRSMRSGGRQVRAIEPSRRFYPDAADDDDRSRHRDARFRPDLRRASPTRIDDGSIDRAAFTGSRWWR